MDLLAEIAAPPHFRPGAEALLPGGLRGEVDAYLAARQPAGFLAALRQRLLLPAHEVHLCGTKYNVPLLNALVFYVGMQARPNPCRWAPVMVREAGGGRAPPCMACCSCAHMSILQAQIQSVWRNYGVAAPVRSSLIMYGLPVHTCELQEKLLL